MVNTFKKNKFKDNIEYKYKRNNQIKARTVKVVEDGVGFVGIMSLNDALNLASNKGLDLVEVSPNANPPVCKIIDWSKFKYEYSKNKKNKSSSSSQLKQMWFKPMIGKGDLERKVNQIKKFLQDKLKVKVMIKPGRDKRLDKSVYFNQMNNILDLLHGHGELENPPRLEGKNLCAIIKPKK